MRCCFGGSFARSRRATLEAPLPPERDGRRVGTVVGLAPLRPSHLPPHDLPHHHAHHDAGSAPRPRLWAAQRGEALPRTVTVCERYSRNAVASGVSGPTSSTTVEGNDMAGPGTEEDARLRSADPVAPPRARMVPFRLPAARAQQRGATKRPIPVTRASVGSGLTNGGC